MHLNYIILLNDSVSFEQLGPDLFAFHLDLAKFWFMPSFTNSKKRNYLESFDFVIPVLHIRQGKRENLGKFSHIPQ